MAADAPPLDASRVAAAFERAPRLVASLAGARHADADQVVAHAAAALREMSDAERAAVLDAHPRIGADPATLSAASSREQGAGADAATRAELAALNEEYEERFGFRCVIFVAGRSPADLIPAIRRRLRNDRAAELEAGIREFLAIARDRLTRTP